MKKRDTYQYIDTANTLELFCSKIEQAPWIALDTEFLREKTYYPQLCLIQIATPKHVACIDPLALNNIEPLLNTIYNPNILKVLHAARQDLEIFYNLRGQLPNPIFDTQLAAPLLGHTDNIGYANLVQQVLGVRLEKAHSRTDWTRRPLSDKQLDYAADDVIYLAELYIELKKSLEAHQRLHWLDHEFEVLCDTNLYANSPQDAWRRVKSADRLKGSHLAILQSLAEWREETARSKNRPRNWLIRDDVLVEIARAIPQTVQALGHVRGLNERSLHKYGKQIIAHVNTSKEQPPIPFPKKAYDKIKLTAQQEEIVDLLQVFIRLRANENALNPSLLATRKTLEKFVCGHKNSLNEGWKKHMIGQDLQAILDGNKILAVKDGKVQLNGAGASAP